MHEMGHLLGMEHTDQGLMDDSLRAGTRSVPAESGTMVQQAPVGDRWNEMLAWAFDEYKGEFDYIWNRPRIDDHVFRFDREEDDEVTVGSASGGDWIVDV
jgi:hypothetical protein